MRARDLAVGLVAFVLGTLIGEAIFLRILRDLSGHGGEMSSWHFIVDAPKTFLFFAVAPFLVALALARKRFGDAVAVPSALCGFFWLPLYTLVTTFTIRYLRAGRPPRLDTGLLAMLLVLVIPPLADYHVIFRGYARLRRRG
jgi:hypothetical protein